MDEKKLLEWSNQYAQSQGFKLNPDKEHVDYIIKGLLANESKSGFRYCPCKVVTGKKEIDSFIICPCATHRQEMEEMSHCHCNLFVKTETGLHDPYMRDKLHDRRHYNRDIVTQRRIAFPEHPSQNGICSVCIKCGICEVGRRAREGRALFPEPFEVAQFGAEKRLPGMQDIQILPNLFGEGVIFRTVKTEGKLGSFNVSIPLVIAAIGSTRVGHVNRDAMMEGAARAGIAIGIGENVVSTYGEDYLKAAIKTFLDNYEGKGAIIVQANVEDKKLKVPEKAVQFGAHGIELKLGQGAKQGLGGEVKLKTKEEAERYKGMGYTIIERADGTFERHSFPGSLTRDGLSDEIVKYSALNVPIWIKVSAGAGIVELLQFLSQLKKEEKIKLEAVTVDGFGGGTGMSPWTIMNETNVPSASILHKVGKLNFDLILAGGFCDGADIAKGMMLGADGIAMGRSILIAANTAQAQGVVNYVASVKEELQMLCAMLRKKDLYEIKGLMENLYPLSAEAAAMFGLKS
jgi:ferredoxin-thioredoxin reductase catalytic subunit